MVYRGEVDSSELLERDGDTFVRLIYFCEINAGQLDSTISVYGSDDRSYDFGNLPQLDQAKILAEISRFIELRRIYEAEG